MTLARPDALDATVAEIEEAVVAQERVVVHARERVYRREPFAGIALHAELDTLRALRQVLARARVDHDLS
jgi:hypothetical protein